MSPPEKPDICYMKGDIRLQEYTVVQDKWPLVVTGKLQVILAQKMTMLCIFYVVSNEKC